MINTFKQKDIRVSCMGKHRHKSRGAAEAHKRALIRFGEEESLISVYPCRYGDHWHVGHRQSN